MGAAISCPACGQKQTVPADSAPPEPDGQLASNTLTDDNPEQPPADAPPMEAHTPPTPPPLPSASEAIDVTTGPILPPAEPPQPPPTSTPIREVAIPARQTSASLVFFQGLLFAAGVIGAFLAGYYFGRQDGATAAPAASTATISPEQSEDGFSDEKVLLDGRLLWMPRFGEVAGDRGAVMLLLPESRVPSQALPIAGLQPTDEPAPVASASAKAIAAAGGVFARAAVDGTTLTVLDREGRYYLLLVSHHVPRPEQQPIRAPDLMQMKQYFADPEGLIGDRKYVWRSEEIRVGAPPIEHDFGLTGLP